MRAVHGFMELPLDDRQCHHPRFEVVGGVGYVQPDGQVGFLDAVVEWERGQFPDDAGQWFVGALQQQVLDRAQQR